jgi:hypothetical protein
MNRFRDHLMFDAIAMLLQATWRDARTTDERKSVLDPGSPG